MGVLGNELFISASRGTRHLTMPQGSYGPNSEEKRQGVNQAMVIGDVDTYGDRTVEVVLKSSSNGFLVMPQLPKYVVEKYLQLKDLRFLLVHPEVSAILTM